MPEPIVEPAAAAPAAPVVAAPQPTAPAAPAAPAAGDEDGDGLPDVLLEIPAVQAVLAGSPPAVSMRLKDAGTRDEVKLIAENRDAMLQAGFNFYRSLSGEFGVMFNMMRIHPEDIQAADKQGQLRKVAPDFDLVNHEVSKLGADHPARNPTVPAGPATSVSGTPPQASSGSLPLSPPPPASVQRKMAQQRVMNMQPGAPTSGPAPGAGRLLNSVLKGVV